VAREDDEDEDEDEDEAGAGWWVGIWARESASVVDGEWH
jgi:hypothetical protein